MELENIKKGEPSDFSVEIDEIKLEPKSTQKVPVTFMSRISKPVQARIVFTSKKEGNTQAAAIVFNLISKVKISYKEKEGLNFLYFTSIDHRKDSSWQDGD